MTTVPPEPNHPRICDYEGSPYRKVFWEQADRNFEDAAERLALRSMLPPAGGRLVDLGAGFGRLVDEYQGYDEVILLDYAHSMLVDARHRLGDRYTYVCADLYRLPFAPNAIDTAVQVRVLHHMEDVPAVFAGVAAALRPGGSYLLEFANKKNLKSIARHLLGQSRADPFDESPHEFVDLNWNFHPAYIERELTRAGLTLRAHRAVSHFRLPLLKQVVPSPILAKMDHFIGGHLADAALAPSQFVRAAKLMGAGNGRSMDARTPYWRCPACGAAPLPGGDDGVNCPACGRHWPKRDGVYVFRDDA